MNIHEGQKLVPSIAEQLIIELFSGQTAQINDIKTKVEEVHAERRGLPYTTKHHPVSLALQTMRQSGLAKFQPSCWSIQSNEEANIKTLKDFIKWANQFQEGDFVFRGVTNSAYKIQASAFRRPVEKERDFEKFIHVNQDLIRSAKQRGYDKRTRPDLQDLDILVELQHFGAATCLIDFSFSAQVALWFACQPIALKKVGNGEPNDHIIPPNGKVSAVRIKTLKYIEITPDLMEEEPKKEIDFFLRKEKESPLYYLQPKFQNNRIIAQQSVLLFGHYQIEADDECIIAEDKKEDILRELQRTSGITEDRLFPDFEGFAWVNREAAVYTGPTSSELKMEAERAIENKEYDVSIEYCSRAINKDDNDAEAYNLRGRAYAGLKDEESYENALADFTEAIRLNKDYADAYYRRGLLNSEHDQYDKAIKDFEETLRYRPNSPYVFYYLGLAKYRRGREEDALEDFDKAIQLKPDYTEVLVNRAGVKLALKFVADAKQDCDVALELAIQQDDVDMQNRIKELLSEIDSLLDGGSRDE